MRAERVLRRDRVPQLLLGRERQRGQLREPVDRPVELLPVERRALEYVGELLAEREVIARTTSPPPRRAASAQPIGDLLLLGEVREQAAGAGEDRHGLDRARGEAEVEHHGGDRQRHVERQRPAPGLGGGGAEVLRQPHVLAGHAALLGQLEDPLGPRVQRLVHRMPEPRQLAARRPDLPGRGHGIDPALARARRAASRTPRPCPGSPARSRGSPPPRHPAATRGRRPASSAPRRSSASSRARRSRSAARRGSSAAPPSAPRRSAADGSTR